MTVGGKAGSGDAGERRELNIALLGREANLTTLPHPTPAAENNHV